MVRRIFRLICSCPRRRTSECPGARRTPAADEPLIAVRDVFDRRLVAQRTREPAPRCRVEDTPADCKAATQSDLRDIFECTAQRFLRGVEPEHQDSVTPGIAFFDDASYV